MILETYGGKLESQRPAILDGFNFNKTVFSLKWFTIIRIYKRFSDGMIGNVAKILPGQVLLLAQREIGKHRQPHVGGGVILFMERQENGAVITGKGLFTPDAEFS